MTLAYTHTHLHTHAHAHTHAHVHTCTHTRTHPHPHPHPHTCTHAHTHAHTHTRTHMHTHTHAHTHAHTRTHTDTHTDRHRHTHTHTHIWYYRKQITCKQTKIRLITSTTDGVTRSADTANHSGDIGERARLQSRPTKLSCCTNKPLYVHASNQLAPRTWRTQETGPYFIKLPSCFLGDSVYIN